MVSTYINVLVNERSGEVVFGTCQIQVPKVSTDTNGTLFFVNWNRNGKPNGIRNGLDETFFTQFLNLNFDSESL